MQGQRTKVVLSRGTLRWSKVLMGARFDGKIYAFQTAPHANCDSEYDIYHIRGLYSGLTVIHFTNRLCMVSSEWFSKVRDFRTYHSKLSYNLNQSKIRNINLWNFPFFQSLLCNNQIKSQVLKLCVVQSFSLSFWIQ